MNLAAKTTDASRIVISLLIALFVIPSFPMLCSAEITADTLKKGVTEEESTPKLNVVLSELEKKSIKLLESGKLEEAEKLLKETIKKDDGTLAELYLLSVFQWKSQEYKDCAKTLEKLLKKDVAIDNRKKLLILKRIGDCYYQNRALDKAADAYTKALKLCDSLEPKDRIRVNLYQSLMGTSTYQKNYPDAEAYGKKLIALTDELAKGNNIKDIAAQLWAHLQLASVYRAQSKEDQRKALSVSTLKIMDSLITLRSELDEAGKIPSIDKIRKIFLKEYIRDNKPSSLAEYLWLAQEFKPLSLPLIEWRPAKGAKAKAVILCIHGLGLDNTSYSAFGHAMAKRGYAIYAMDVRGFGSWLTIPGEEDVGFDDALRDIMAVVKIVKNKHPKTPVYLLGESMGGGIALRAGAKYGDFVDGIIASVPSAERFQGKRMGFTVAVHLLRDSDRPFNIGHTVATQATTNEALQNAWEESYKSKMKMTPVELMKFAVFMRTTQMHCKEIKDTPVYIVQGLKDRLVKPQGTYKMFDAVSADDKTMMIIGTAEHLIFETDNQSKVLLDSLSSWLDRHSKESM